MAKVEDAKDRLQGAVDALESAVGEIAGADIRAKILDLEQSVEKLTVDLDAAREKIDALSTELSMEKEQSIELRDTVLAAAKTVDRLVGELNKLL